MTVTSDSPGQAAGSLIDDIKRAVRDGTLTRADQVALAACDDPAVLRSAGRALAKLPADAGLRTVKIGILSTATAGPLEYLLRARLAAAGMAARFTAGEYGAFDLTLAEAAGDVFAGQDVVFCLLDESYLLPRDWAGGDIATLTEFITARAAGLRQALVAAAGRAGATVLVHTVPLSAHVRNTVISWRDRAALSACWARANADLLDLAEARTGVHVIDFVSDLADAAVPAGDDRLRHYADIPYTDGALAVLADQVRRFTQAKVGLSRKVLALDLDNTLWGGVLGEVGAAGVELGGLYPGKSYKELQRTAARLRDQGVILVLASKNDADHVDAALREHPEMVLRPELFSATAVNWQPKAGNLKLMADGLDLGINAFVFLDDSPFERGHVAAEQPDVTVLAADGDPAYLVGTLVRGGWFDTLELTDTDRKRPAMYKARTERTEFAGGFGSSEDYLGALDVTVTITTATDFEAPRIAQLAARTNQYNLTGIRYSQPETAKLIAEEDHLVISWAVRDRFGDEGIVGAAWIDTGEPTWRVANLVMSCRVLGRGVELSVLGWLVRQARAAGARTLEGRFVPSARNGVAADLWNRAGLVRADQGEDAAEQVYTLDLADAADLVPAWIRLEER